MKVEHTFDLTKKNVMYFELIKIIIGVFKKKSRFINKGRILKLNYY